MSQTRLFVGNLPNDTHDSDLRSAFSNYGEVVNLDIKSKSNVENDPKKFAFVTISGGNNDVESCIKYFSSTDYKGSRLYVTRARESFLERLQRERAHAENKAVIVDHSEASKTHPILNLGDKLNPRKRKIDAPQSKQPERNRTVKKEIENNTFPQKNHNDSQSDKTITAADKKKQEADKKRMESMQKKRQEFKNKQKIIKTGLIGIDKVFNKKTRFFDIEDDTVEPSIKNHDTELKLIKKNALFNDDDESDGEVNFEIKKQFEGKKGQKVLDLQSRYKSDRRFVLDERFIEDQDEEDQNEEQETDKDLTDQGDQVEVSQGDEKSKQFKILEDVLGVAIKTHVNKSDKDRKAKPNMGMIRFDPMNPEHAKFVVPIEEVKQETKKTKKNKMKQSAEPSQPAPDAPKVEVSKEQFYKSEITKEAFLQPATGFSLRSLFAKDDEGVAKEQESNYTPLPTQKQQKVKNPLDPGEKNPFVYDSSESEDEDQPPATDQQTAVPDAAEVKAVWRENLFFTKDDSRLTDGLTFFNNSASRGAPKERRELKSVMMKRIHNTERKNQMFKRKIGGRKKSMKKSYKKKS